MKVGYQFFRLVNTVRVKGWAYFSASPSILLTAAADVQATELQYRTGYLRTSHATFAEKAENGSIPLETTGLVDKAKDKLHVKSEQDAFSMSGAGSSSHNSQSTNSRTSQRTYDKLSFPRHELQTLGMLGLSLLAIRAFAI